MRYVWLYLLRRPFPFAEAPKPKGRPGGKSKHRIPDWHTERPEEERRSIVKRAKDLGPAELARRITRALHGRGKREE